MINVVVKFLVYSLPSAKKINASAVYISGDWLCEILPAIFKKIFSTDLPSKRSHLHKTTAKTSKIQSKIQDISDIDSGHIIFCYSS